eukprot:3555462-Prymnesium_polylepis.1
MHSHTARRQHNARATAPWSLIVRCTRCVPAPTAQIVEEFGPTVLQLQSRLASEFAQNLEDLEYGRQLPGEWRSAGATGGIPL